MDAWRKPAEDAAEALGRILLAHMYLYFGWTQLRDMAGLCAGGCAAASAGYSGYLQSHGLDPRLIYAAIAVQLIGGGLLLLGLATRWAAAALIGFTLAASWFFHRGWGAPPNGHVNMLLFMKNMAMAGGLLIVLARGAGRFSLDRLRSGRSTDVEA